MGLLFIFSVIIVIMGKNVVVVVRLLVSLVRKIISVVVVSIRNIMLKVFMFIRFLFNYCVSLFFDIVVVRFRLLLNSIKIFYGMVFMLFYFNRLFCLFLDLLLLIINNNMVVVIVIFVLDKLLRDSYWVNKGWVI